jgi:outer membrane biosynthesis protein TonB
MAREDHANIISQRSGPQVKKKTLEGHASFAAFLGQAGVSAATAPATSEPKPAARAKVVRKRKAVDEVPEDAEDSAKDLDPPSAADKSEGDKSDSKKKAPAVKKEKKAPTQKKEPIKGKGRPKKVVKKEESASEEEVKGESAENSADGGDGLGEFSFHKNIKKWLDHTDGQLDGEVEDDI